MSAGIIKKSVDLAKVEPRQAEVKSRAVKLVQLKRQHLVVPCRFLRRTVIGEPVCPRLFRRQLGRDMNRHGIQAELLGSRQANVACQDDTFVIDHDGLAPAKFLD